MATLQNQTGIQAVPTYGIFVPVLNNKIISGSDWASVSIASQVYGICPGGASPGSYEYHYFLYLKVGVVYRFSFSALRFNTAGILQFSIKSDNAVTTYNTLTNVDLYIAGADGTASVNKQTFTFSPGGYANGTWVPCLLDVVCNSKNASSSNFFTVFNSGSSGYSFYEKYS